MNEEKDIGKTVRDAALILVGFAAFIAGITALNHYYTGSQRQQVFKPSGLEATLSTEELQRIQNWLNSRYMLTPEDINIPTNVNYQTKPNY